MAALDFPASPTNGQVFTSSGSSWTYDSTKVAWRSSPYEPGAAITSATAPTTPQNGDIWFNTNDGTLYTYYNDGTSSQWVELRSEIAKSQVGLVPIVPTSLTVATGTASADVSGLVTFTGATSVSLNGVFSAAYANYLLKFDYVTSTSTANTIRLRSGTTDESGSNYAVGRTYQIDNTGGFQHTGLGTGWGTTPTTAQKFEADMYLFKPFIAVQTHGYHIGAVATSVSSGSTLANQVGKQIHQLATSYDGISLIPNAGNFTGTAKIYGYN